MAAKKSAPKPRKPKAAKPEAKPESREPKTGTHDTTADHDGVISRGR